MALWLSKIKYRVVSQFFSSRGSEHIARYKQVFILPTRYGLYAAGALLASFALAVRIQSNLLLLMTLVIFVLYVLSLIWTTQQLIGLKVSLDTQALLTAGYQGPYHFYLELQAAKSAAQKDMAPKETHGLYIYDRDEVGGRFDIKLPSLLKKHFNIRERGAYQAPLIKISSDFPLGLAKAWAYLKPPTIWVAPALLSNQVFESYVGSRWTLPTQFAQADYFDSLKNATPQDSDRSIDWKRWARTGKKLAKISDHTAVEQTSYVWRYEDYAHHGHELCLSILMTGVKLCEQHGCAWQLLLPESPLITDLRTAYDALAKS